MGYLGEDTPKLGFGLMRLPKLDSGDIDVEQVKLMVDEFLAAGCTYFDTARAYGDSEAAIRQALVERYPRDSYTLATKNAAWIGPKSYEDARKDFDISLENTGAGYFDYYLIHNTGGVRTAVFDRLEMWDFVRELKEQGKVKHIGFSHHDNAELLDELLTAHPYMEFVQLQVNYVDWESANVQSRKCVEVAQAHGKPIVIMEPVRGGTLANPPEPVANILSAANPDASYVEWALRFAFGVPGLLVALSGMSSLEQMQENLATWKAYQPLSDDEYAVLATARDELFRLLDNPCTSCHYCEKSCPQNIPIAGVMESLNRAGTFGFANGRNWYGFSTGGRTNPEECVQCYSCEGACPQGIPIVEKLAHAVEMFENGEPHTRNART